MTDDDDDDHSDNIDNICFWGAAENKHSDHTDVFVNNPCACLCDNSGVLPW